ncbi:MAG: bacteriohemerythrin [Rhodocyclaceae bacterium]|nr:MAG: bacteriohemerythrin [Rhodocyclaceae bacterium]
MALMTWNSNFVTGIDIIDEQHQWLIDLINAAAPVLAIDYDSNHKRADGLLDQLIHYAGFHFATEDRLMREYGIDPRHQANHLDSHGSFAATVTQMRKDYASGDAPSGSKLLSFLANWLIYHILGEDQALARQMKAIDAGMTPAEAFEKAEGARRDPTHEALTQALIDVYVLMTDQNRKLLEYNHELADHRTRLEELVQGRTADLVRALDAAQAANRARSSFIANMSHEIRTPMNAIVGLTWSLRQNASDPAQRLRLDQVGDAAKQLLAIINDLLDMARIESDRLTLEPLDFDPQQVLQEVVRDVSSAATVKGLVLKLDAPDLPPLLRGDPVRLGQILGNFASNAVKFTERGRIEIRAFRLPGGNGRQQLRFEVRDSGPGIAESDRARLFQPFEQLDSSLTRKHGGTGLGLAISRRLAEMMGGRIGVDSAPNEGATFWLEVPLEVVQSGFRPAPARADAAAEGLGGKDAQPSSVVLERHRKTLQRIAQLLADDDVQAIPLWHESAAQLRDAFDGRAEPFESALAAYDFAAAHALLQQTLALLESDR